MSKELLTKEIVAYGEIAMEAVKELSRKGFSVENVIEIVKIGTMQNIASSLQHIVKKLDEISDNTDLLERTISLGLHDVADSVFIINEEE